MDARATVIAFAVALASMKVGSAHAQEPSKIAPSPTAAETHSPAPSGDAATAEAPAPPPLNTPYLQYGVSLTAEFLASAGRMCDVASEPCILGSGGGIAVRIGKRTASPWYFGGAYELSKQDPNKLYRLAILQQARVEARYYLDTGRDVQPYGHFGGGAAGYGNEWGIDTYGPMGFLALGAEVQLSRKRVVGASLAYRMMHLSSFTDSSRTPREAGIVQFIGLDLILEARDPL
jgi:hypothetical protein